MRYAFRDSVRRFPLARSVPSGRWCAKSCWVGPGERDLMSKAFVKETDDEDDLPDEPLAIPAGVKNYMTPEGHRRMQEELRQLLRWSARKWWKPWPGPPGTATGRRTATISTASAACARLTGASASCPSGWKAPKWSTH